jgi:5-methylcytosine-specific restriction protein A
MAKLKALASVLPKLSQAIGYAQGDAKAYDRQRAQHQPFRAWYKTARWQALREQVLVRDRYTCRMCGRIAADGMAVDHIKPHRGKPALFWDQRNLQVLCVSPCHNKHKQAIEQSEPAGQWD